MKRLIWLVFVIGASAPGQTIDYNKQLKNKPIDVTNVMWYGADATGVTSSATALMNAWTAAQHGTGPQFNGGQIIIPCGNFKISSTVTFPTSKGMQFLGSGKGCTTFTWAGNSSSPMFLVNDCNQCTFANFTIKAAVATPMLYGFQQQNSGSGTRWTSSLDTYKDIEIQCSDGGCTDGIFWGNGTDGNNDQNFIHNVTVENYANAAFEMNNTQIYDNVFDHSTCQSDGFGNYCVKGTKGNVIWMDGNGGGNVVADFFLNIYAGVNIFRHGRFESSKRFLVTSGPVDNAATIVIDGIQFPGNCLGDSAANIKAATCTAPGGDMIQDLTGATLSITNSNFGVNNVSPLTIFKENFGAGFNGTLRVSSTVISSSETTSNSIFTTTGGILPILDGSSYWYNTSTAAKSILANPTIAVGETGFTANAASTQDIATFPTNSAFFTQNSIATLLTNITDSGGATSFGKTIFIKVNDTHTTVSCNVTGNIQCSASSPVATVDPSLMICTNIAGSWVCNFTGK